MGLAVKRSNLALAVAGVLTVGGSVRGAAIVTPDGVAPGQSFYVVFVTNELSNAVSAVPETYDAVVQIDGSQLAYEGNPVTWKALVSTEISRNVNTTTAISRFNPDAPVFLPDGTKVADNGADFWDGDLDHAINQTPGATLAMDDNTRVWTGTVGSGAQSANIGTLGSGALGNTDTKIRDDLSVAPSSALTGDAQSSDFAWTNSLFQENNATAVHRLYAFSNELVAVPEPASAGLLGSMLAVFGLRRNKRS